MEWQGRTADQKLPNHLTRFGSFFMPYPELLAQCIIGDVGFVSSLQSQQKESEEWNEM